MHNINKTSFNRHITTFLIILSIALISFLSYKDKLSYFFTSTAVLAITENGIFESFSDVIDIFTEDLMTGTSFRGHFYRPILALSLGIDYSIWKLNPFGYHLTDIIIHIFVSISVFFCARLLTKGDRMISWLSAMVFTLHPVIISTVIGIDKRNDTLSTLFLMLSLITFLKYFSATSFRKFFLSGSIIFYALAFGSKEIGIIVPFIVFSYLLIMSDKSSSKGRIIQAFKGAVPYLITAFILVAWRSYVLSSLVGGYGLFPDDVIILNYINYLLNPTGFLNRFNDTVIVFLLPLIPILLLPFFYKRLVSGGRGISTFKKIMMSGLLLSSILILSYPVLGEPLMKFTYDNESARFLKDFLTNTFLKGNDLSLSLYVWNLRMILLNKLYILLFFFMFCLLFTLNYGYSRKHFFPVTDKGKLMTFLFIWLLTPLIVYLSVVSLATWQMYIALIPFSIFLSVTFVEGIRSLKRSNDSASGTRISVGVATCILLLILLYSTPIGFRETGKLQDEWRDLTKVRSVIFLALLGPVSDLSENGTTVIKINNIPTNYWTPELMLRSWINLNNPDNNVTDIIINMAPPVEAGPELLDFDIKVNRINDTLNEIVVMVNDFKNNKIDR